MNKLEQTGIIHAITPVKEYGSNGFTKREIVLEIEDGKYPQLVPFELVKDKCALADAYEVGQTVTIHFNLRGREWKDENKGETRYFGSLSAWRIEDVGGSTHAPAPSTETVADTDEIPF